ncbi:MAG: PaaI family thioesterase [Burkholderiales bacterium]|nr:PaaI family thioesterase [Burkholderiales bacterium]
MPPMIPDGFVPLRLRPNPYIDACGPLYGRREGDGFCLGLRVERRHCNPGGSCHGGMLTTLADMLLVLGAGVLTGQTRYMLTVQLSCDFMAPAMEGAWIEGRLQVLRSTRSLVFCQGRLDAEGAQVLRLSGIAKPSGPGDDSFTLAHYLGEVTA